MTETLICVEWTDAHGNAMAIYEQHEVPHAPAIVRTFGLLIRQDAAGITLANEIFEAGSYRGVTFIPAGMVQSVIRYAVAKPKRRRPSPPPTTPAAPHLLPVGPDEHVE